MIQCNIKKEKKNFLKKEKSSSLLVKRMWVFHVNLQVTLKTALFLRIFRWTYCFVDGYISITVFYRQLNAIIDSQIWKYCLICDTKCTNNIILTRIKWNIRFSNVIILFNVSFLVDINHWVECNWNFFCKFV